MGRKYKTNISKEDMIIYLHRRHGQLYDELSRLEEKYGPDCYETVRIRAKWAEIHNLLTRFRLI